MHPPHSSQTTEFSLFVGDLPLDCNDEKLQRLFQQKFKSVKRVQIIKNEDGSSRGFGFIRFEDRGELQTALSQEMKIGNVSLRLDMAHTREYHNRYNKPNRGRYNSFNSTGNNNNNKNPNNNNNNNNTNHNHPSPSMTTPLSQAPASQQPLNNRAQQHQHQHQQHHHHHHQQQSHSRPQQTQPTSNNIPQNQANQQPVNNRVQQQQQQPQSTHEPTQHTQSSPTTNALAQSPAIIQPLNNRVQQQQSTHAASQQQSPTTNTLAQTPALQQSVTNRVQQQQQLNVNNGTQTIGTTTISHSTPGSSLPNSHHLNTTPQAISHDFRGHYSNTTNPILDNTHLLNPPDQATMMSPSNVYGHLYPYGPPTFGYMPAQPNPVIPISGVSPAASQQSPSTATVNQQQQHGVHPMPAGSATGNRYNNGSHPSHHQIQAHAGPTDTGTLGAMPGANQNPHQGAPQLYYYYPNPYLFDHQVGGAGGPPILYHPQTFHPQYFTMPNPYMPNAHPYNQHPTQPPPASQSDSTILPTQQPLKTQPQTTTTNHTNTSNANT